MVRSELSTSIFKILQYLIHSNQVSIHNILYIYHILNQRAEAPSSVEKGGSILTEGYPIPTHPSDSSFKNWGKCLKDQTSRPHNTIRYDRDKHNLGNILVKQMYFYFITYIYFNINQHSPGRLTYLLFIIHILISYYLHFNCFS